MILASVFLGLVFIFYANVGWGQVSITSLSVAYTENFNGMGTSATATLPAGFRVNTTANWTTGTTTTTQAAGTTGTGALTSTSPGGTYNFADGITGSSTERALGFLTSGSFSSPRSIIFAFTNNTGATVTSLDISFNYEKYRSGTRAFDWTFFHGDVATSVNTSAPAGNQSYVADADNNTVFNPPSSISKTFSISSLSIANGTTYYLCWTYTGVGGSTNAQGLGIDNFSITLQSATFTSTLASSAALTEPATISALGTAFTGATPPQQNAVANFDFRFIDDNGSGGDTDDTRISQIVFNAGTGNSVTNWADAIAEALLSDGTNTQTTTTIGASSITFASIPNGAGQLGRVADNATKTYTLTIRFKTAMTGSAPTTIDGQDFVFLVNNSSFTFVAGGLAASQSVNSGDGNNTVVVVATELRFVTQPPTNTVVNTNFSTNPSVQATDANGNRDLNYTNTITLSLSANGCGTIAGSNPVNAVAGLATFGSPTPLQINRVQKNIHFIATGSGSPSVTSVNSNTFNVTKPVNPVILAAQNFDALNSWGYATPTSANTTVCIGGSGSAVTSFSNTRGVSGSNAFTKSHSVDNSSGQLLSETTLTFDNVTIPSGATNIKVTFKVRSVDVDANPGTGVDSGNSPNCNDRIVLESSIDGGSTYSLTFNHRSTGGDQTWNFDDNPQTRAYNANDDNTQYNCGAYTITFPDGTTQVRIRFKFRNNRTNEMYALDDIFLLADLPPVPAKHYRTVSSGDFNSACPWEIADDEAFTTGVTFASLPPDFNALTVKVRNGHTITTDATENTDIDQLTVETGGTLICQGATFRIVNGTGIDLTVNGTFIDRNTNNKFTGSTATWVFGANGTMIRTKNSSATEWRDRYDGGMSNIPATANWIIRRENAGDSPSLTAVDTFYPNLTLENNVTGTWDATGVGSKFTGASGFCTVKGNMDVGGTGTGTVIIYNENTNAQPMLIQGDLIVRAGNTLTTNSIGRGFELSNGNLIVNGTLNATGGTGLGIARFSSTSAEQTISGTAGSVNIANLEVNKSASFDLKLLRNINEQERLHSITAISTSTASILI